MKTPNRTVRWERVTNENLSWRKVKILDFTLIKLTMHAGITKVTTQIKTEY